MIGLMIDNSAPISLSQINFGNINLKISVKKLRLILMLIYHLFVRCHILNNY